jgi:Toprim domain-containing protein/uncharacterized protein DUF3991
MHDDELHRFKSDIHFLHYAADRYGYRRDRRESSVASHVLRHPATDDKIVVRKDRDGHWTYFSVRDDRDHGTIIDFVQRRGRHLSLGSVREELRSWLGMARPVPDYLELPRRSPPAQQRPFAEVFEAARVASSCDYLIARGLRSETLSDPRFAGTWRLGPRGNVLFAHRDDTGVLTGFEIKNRGFTGFAAGGLKSAWQSAIRESDRALAVTESAIDALSHHQLHAEQRETTRYLSIGGQPSPAQIDLLDRTFARLPRATTVVAAVDADVAGHALAGRIRELAHGHSLAFRRDLPERAKDWNEVLQRVERDYIRSLLSGPRARAGPER